MLKRELNGETEGSLPEEGPDAGIAAWRPWNGRRSSLYQVGDEVMHNGSHWVSTAAHNQGEPGVEGWIEHQAFIDGWLSS